VSMMFMAELCSRSSAQAGDSQNHGAKVLEGKVGEYDGF
jgi:hypothetical protein